MYILGTKIVRKLCTILNFKVFLYTFVKNLIYNVMRLLTTFILFVIASFSNLSAQVTITSEHKAAAEELLNQMTLSEKIGLIGSEKSFYTRAIPRLGIPQIRMADGPQGVRNNTQSTMYPCGILTASTWSRELAERLGHGLGQDAKARGVSILLGPGVNIYRAPMCGRNFEYFGEDPYLTGETAKHYILGVQSEGVMATVKHFAANNQEWSRHHASSDVDERTMHEIYFPAFRKAVQEAGVGSVMNSYNPIFGVHATENRWLNFDVLRDQWGFEGILMSDWTSVYSTSGALTNGIDLECPKAVYFTEEKILPLLENGVVTIEDIDNKVRNILQTLIAFGMLDTPRQDTSIELDNQLSKSIALDIARQGVVLLKNESNILPVKKGKILILGPNADRVPTGGGSGFVHPYSTVSVYEGLKQVKGDKNLRFLSEDDLYVNILDDVYTDSTFTTRGFTAKYFRTVRPEGNPFRQQVDTVITHYWKYGSPFPGMPDDKFSVVWTGCWKAPRTGVVRFSMGGDDGYRVIVDEKNLGGDWGNHSYNKRDIFFPAEEGKVYNLKFEFFDSAGEATVTLVAGQMDDVKLAKSVSEVDKVIFCGGFDSSIEGEGFDRSFELPSGQRRMINQLTLMSDNVIVVLNAGGGVDFNGWSEKVKGVLMAWYPGQEGGTALAEIISGKISPSGKLPISIENEWKDNPVYDSYYDRRNVPHKRVEYKEGVFVGYRGYDKRGIAPRYPFGFGLSYTTFSYSNLKLNKIASDKVTVEYDVTNTGKMDAWETTQIYVTDEESSVPRPKKELKGYEKVFVKRGETVHVSTVLDLEAFSFYDIITKRFVVEPGDFIISVGPSSAELPLTAKVTL